MGNKEGKVQTIDQQNENNQHISLELNNQYTNQNTSVEIIDHNTNQNTCPEINNHHTNQEINNYTNQETSNHHTDQNIILEIANQEINNHINQEISNHHTAQNTSLEMNNNRTVKNTNPTPDVQRKCTSVSLLAAAIFSALGSFFLKDYSSSVVNAPSEFVQEFYNQTWIERNGEPLGEERTTLLWFITVSIFSIGGFIGAILATVFTQVVGRKGTLLLSNAFTLAGALLMATSEKARSFEMMIIGRLLAGLNAGIALNASTMYLTEISPKQRRGGICQINQVVGNIGLLIGQVLGLPELLGTVSRWNYLFAFQAVPALLQLAVLPFLPESPRFLLMAKNNKAAAEKAYRQLTGKENVSQELAEVHTEMASQAQVNSKALAVLELLRDPAVRWQVITMCVLTCCTQLSGLNALFYYTDSILEDAGIAIHLISYIVLSTAATKIVFSFAMKEVVDRLGRKLLLLIGFGGMAACYALLTLLLNFQDKATWIPYLSFGSILAVIAFYSVAPGSVVIGEIFAQNYRPAAIMIAGMLRWLCSFVLALVFPYMQEALQTFVFLVFVVICSACFIFTLIVIPETKNKTFVEINHSFAKRNKVPVPEAAP